MSDYELVFKTSKRYESWLEQNFSAEGKGLQQKISSVEAELPSDIVRRFRKIASIRNKLMHEDGYELSPREMDEFVETSRFIDEELDSLVSSRVGSPENQASPPAVWVTWSHQHCDLTEPASTSTTLKTWIAIVIAISVFWGLNKVDSWYGSNAPEQVAKKVQIPIAENKKGKEVSGRNRKTAESKVDAALVADIEDAKPFVSNVLEKIRCKPDDFRKQNALFESVSAPGINSNGWIGPWAGFTFPDGTCMTPVATYGWTRERDKRSGAELSVQVKWKSSEAVVTKQTIALRKVPDLGWRVTTMVSGR